MNIYDLIVRQVSSLVSVTADETVKQSGKSVLEEEAYLYRHLAANCKDKAETAAGMAALQNPANQPHHHHKKISITSTTKRSRSSSSPQK